MRQIVLVGLLVVGLVSGGFSATLEKKEDGLSKKVGAEPVIPKIERAASDPLKIAPKDDNSQALPEAPKVVKERAAEKGIFLPGVPTPLNIKTRRAAAEGKKENSERVASDPLKIAPKDEKSPALPEALKVVKERAAPSTIDSKDKGFISGVPTPLNIKTRRAAADAKKEISKDEKKVVGQEGLKDASTIVKRASEDVVKAAVVKDEKKPLEGAKKVERAAVDAKMDAAADEKKAGAADVPKEAVLDKGGKKPMEVSKKVKRSALDAKKEVLKDEKKPIVAEAPEKESIMKRATDAIKSMFGSDEKKAVAAETPKDAATVKRASDTTKVALDKDEKTPLEVSKKVKRAAVDSKKEILKDDKTSLEASKKVKRAAADSKKEILKDDKKAVGAEGAKDATMVKRATDDMKAALDENEKKTLEKPKKVERAAVDAKKELVASDTKKAGIAEPPKDAATVKRAADTVAAVAVKDGKKPLEDPKKVERAAVDAKKELVGDETKTAGVEAPKDVATVKRATDSLQSVPEKDKPKAGVEVTKDPKVRRAVVEAAKASEKDENKPLEESKKGDAMVKRASGDAEKVSKNEMKAAVTEAKDGKMVKRATDPIKEALQKATGELVQNATGNALKNVVASKMEGRDGIAPSDVKHQGYGYSNDYSKPSGSDASMNISSEGSKNETLPVDDQSSTTPAPPGLTKPVEATEPAKVRRAAPEGVKKDSKLAIDEKKVEAVQADEAEREEDGENREARMLKSGLSGRRKFGFKTGSMYI